MFYILTMYFLLKSTTVVVVIAQSLVSLVEKQVTGKTQHRQNMNVGGGCQDTPRATKKGTKPTTKCYEGVQSRFNRV